MHVELAADLVAEDSTDHLQLFAVLAHGATGRHRIVAEDREGLHSWIEGLGDKDLGEEVSLVLDEGERRAAIGTRKAKTLVSGVGGRSGTVSLKDALLLLGYPFRVLLENGRTDRDFLLAFTDTATRRELSEAEASGWLLFETAGGLGEVKKRLEEIVGSSAGSPVAKRAFIVVDSDATAPGELSKAALEVGELLTRIESEAFLRLGTLGHVLSRRAIENYLPLSEFKNWLSERFGRRKVAQASERWKQATERGEKYFDHDSSLNPWFAALALQEVGGTDVIPHYDFSRGRGSEDNEDNKRTADAVWNQLSPLQQFALKGGLTKKFIRDFFSRSRDLRDPEIASVVHTILERM